MRTERDALMAASTRPRRVQTREVPESQPVRLVALPAAGEHRILPVARRREIELSLSPLFRQGLGDHVTDVAVDRRDHRRAAQDLDATVGRVLLGVVVLLDELGDELDDEAALRRKAKDGVEAFEAGLDVRVEAQLAAM